MIRDYIEAAIGAAALVAILYAMQFVEFLK